MLGQNESKTYLYMHLLYFKGGASEVKSPKSSLRSNLFYGCTYFLLTVVAVVTGCLPKSVFQCFCFVVFNVK